MTETNFSAELKQVLNESTQQALRHNTGVIRPEHILMAIISDASGKGFRLVERASGSSSAYELQQHLDKYLFESALENHGTEGATPSVSVSDIANRLIKLSVLEARMLKNDTVDVEHLLLAIFHNPETQAMDFMNAFIQAGVTYDAIYSQLTWQSLPVRRAHIPEVTRMMRMTHPMLRRSVVRISALRPSSRKVRVAILLCSTNSAMT